MKSRRLVLLLIAATLAAAPVFSQSQVDIGINVPAQIGISIDGESVTDQIPFRIPVPDLMYNYFFLDGDLSIGVGARLWTLILISGGYPIVSAQLEIDRVVLNAHIGGGVFAYFSPFPEGSGIQTGDVFFPEVSAMFRLTDSFSIGVSALGVLVPELTDDFGYTINAVARFTLR